MANDIDEAAVHVLVQYLDPDARKGLTKLSRVGRDCVLISSPNAKLRFSLAEGVSPAAANAVRAGLLVRGQFNTALLLECGHSPVSADISAQISALAECLQGASEGIREVELRGTSAARPTPTCTAAQLMQRVVLPALPHITTLTLTHFPCSLPALAQLSQLRKVSFSLPTQPADPPANDHQIASLAAFLSQVTSLELHNCSAPAACSVFSQAPITHTLTHFATDAPLTDELARLLVDKAPALKDLCVREVALTTGELRDSQWVVERLTVTRLGAFPQSLATLPRSTADEFVLSSDELMICSEGCSEEQAERMLGWHFNVRAVVVRDIGPTMPQLLQRLRLQNGTAIAFYNCPTHLADAQRRAPVLTALAERRRSHVYFHDPPEAARDTCVAAVAALDAHVQQLSMRTGEVRPAAGLAGVAWPWQRLMVEKGRDQGDGDVLEFLRQMPSPETYRGAGRPVVVYSDLLSLTSLSAAEQVDWLQNWWAHVKWRGPGFKIHYNTLETTLPFLSSINFDFSDEHAVLELSGLPMTHETMAMLRGLPAWRGALVLSDCRWPLPAAEYRQLAAYIPDSYEEWWPAVDTWDDLHMSIEGGIVEYRESKGLPLIPVIAIEWATGEEVLRRRKEHHEAAKS